MVNFLSIPWFKNQKETGARMCATCFWYYYWGCASQLLTKFFSILSNSPRILCKSSLGLVSLLFLKWQILDELFFVLVTWHFLMVQMVQLLPLSLLQWLPLINGPRLLLLTSCTICSTVLMQQWMAMVLIVTQLPQKSCLFLRNCRLISFLLKNWKFFLDISWSSTFPGT